MNKQIRKLLLNRETLYNLGYGARSNAIGAGTGEGSVGATNCGTCDTTGPTGINGSCSCGRNSCVSACEASPFVREELRRAEV
jgi:hypothetical protein